MRAEPAPSLRRRDPRSPALARLLVPGALAVTACFLPGEMRARDGEGSSKAEAAIVAGVSGPRAARTARDLVQIGPRMGGTPSGDRAAIYVRRRFEEGGLSVEEIIDPPKEVHEERSWSLAVIEPAGIAIGAWPVGFSPSIPSSELLVLDSPPRDANSPAWALLSDEKPVIATKRALRDGARAVLLDRQGDETLAGSAAPAMEFPASGRPGVLPAFAVSRDAGRALRARLAEKRAVRVRVELDSHNFEGTPRTIVGTLPGTGRGWYLVCAHGDSDSGGPGADDNASGVASLIEAALSLASAAKGGLLPAERPSIRFAVWGSEVFSTRSYVRSRAPEMDDLLGVFNYDETAASTEKDALYFEGNDVPWNAAMLRALLSVASDYAGRDGFPREYTTNPSLGGTDAYVFLPVKYRGDGLVTRTIPSTTVFTAAWGKPETVTQSPGWQSPAWPERGSVTVDYSRYYHSSGDLPEATTDLHPESMARCARVVALAILRLLTPAG